MPGDVDLRLVASRAICSSVGVDGATTIDVTAGTISRVAGGLPARHSLPRARTVLNVSDGVLMPGLVDLHAHPSLEGSRFGVDSDVYLLPRGSTTVLSQGDAGARNLDQFLRHTVEASRTRVKLAINFCANGESNPAGRFSSLEEASVDECVAAVGRGGDHVWGLSVNIAFIRGRDVDPLEVLRRGIAAAEKAERPVMFGATKNSAVPLDAQLALLRPGDVMTYCFHEGEGSIVQRGKVLDCVWEARERGVLFDVGDGAAAFGFRVAEQAIREGFLPDTISSDFYRRHVEIGLPHDLPRTASKLIAAGMTAEQCWPRITSVPAGVLGLADSIGALRPGSHADLTVLRLSEHRAQLRDGHGQIREGRLWEPTLTFKSGERVEPRSPIASDSRR
jgi:dihydroorotase